MPDPPSGGELERGSGSTTVLVVSAADGSPIESALVRVDFDYARRDPNHGFREGLTGPDGRVTLPDRLDYVCGRWLIRKRGFQTVMLDDSSLIQRCSEPIRLVPVPPLVGRVVLAGSGVAVAGARVVAWLADDWHAGGLDEPQTTAASGAFEFAGAPLDRPLRVAAAADGLGSVIVPIAPGGGRHPLVIEIGSGAVLCGTVRDTAGLAVAGAEVFACERGGDDPLGDPPWDYRRGIHGDEVEILRVRTRSGADGVFCFRGLATPAAYVVSARTQSGAIGRSDPVELRDASARGERAVTVAATGTIVVLAPATPDDAIASLRPGRVWRDGAWSDVPDRQKGRWSPRDGVVEFTLTDVPAGPHRVHFDLPGWVAGVRSVEVAPGGRVEVRLELDRGAALTGRLIDAEGKPVEGTVYFGATTDGIVHAAQAATRSDGGFTLPALPPVVGTLSAYATGYAQVEREGVVPGTEEVQTLVLTRGPTVVGRLRAGTDSGRVWAGYETADGGGEPCEMVEEGGVLRIDGIPSDVACHVFVKAKGHVPYVRRDIRVRAGGTLDLGEIAFPDPRALAGAVRDPRKAPIPGATIRSIDAWSGAETHSDGSGAFRLPLLPPGATTVAVVIDGAFRAWTTVDMRAAEESIEIVVPDAGRIVARVTNARRESQAALPLNLAPLGDEGRIDWRRRVIVRTDSVGRVEATVAPGRYRLAPHSSTRRAWATALPDLVVSSGETVSLDLVLE